MAPEDPDVTVTPVPPIKYEDPSVSLVKDPDNPVLAYSVPETNTSPPKAEIPNIPEAFPPIDPDTKKFVSVPGILAAPMRAPAALKSTAAILVAALRFEDKEYVLDKELGEI